MSYLELRDISKVYGEGATEVRALDRIDLVVEEGSLVAVMGASGSGKSTLLTIAGSLEDPSSGEVYVGGDPFPRCPATPRHNCAAGPSVTYFRTTTCSPGSARSENVALPLELDGVSARKAQARAKESLEEFGLQDRASHYPTNFRVVSASVSQSHVPSWAGVNSCWRTSHRERLTRRTPSPSCG